ncbi:hypothetical protein ACW9IK_33205, partial [Pseudomonas gingeri]
VKIKFRNPNCESSWGFVFAPRKTRGDEVLESCGDLVAAIADKPAPTGDGDEAISAASPQYARLRLMAIMRASL